MEIDKYLPALEEEVGEIKSVKEYSPGVYHIDAIREEQFLLEYFAVLDTAPMAEKVRPYGKELDGLRLYDLEDDACGWRVVQYEISKYSISVKEKPVPEELFRDMTLHAMEVHPEYFGTFPVPFHTPHGFTLRYRTLANGIYWLETSECEELLAVCFPIWNAELSPAAAVCGKVMACDENENATPYRFFPKRFSSVPIYELMETRKEWEGTVISLPALMNAIWENIPTYAMRLNGQPKPITSIEILEEMGLEMMPQTDGRRIIGMFPDAGTDFLLLK